MTQNRERHFSTLLSQPLAGSDLHIWCASLNVSPEDLSHYLSLLSPDEKTRAQRFYFEIDRNHFIVGRGLLRTILGCYLNIEPARIEFVYGQYGKPALKPGLHDQVLEFNLSHSKDMALYIFSLNRKIGIDIEYIHSMPNMDKFAEEFFSLGENTFIDSLPENQKLDALFKIWTCKEAFLKANGFGLTVPINQVEISLESEQSTRLLSIGGDQEQAARWHLETFIPVTGYQASLAFEGHARQVILRRLNDS